MFLRYLETTLATAYLSILRGNRVAWRRDSAPHIPVGELGQRGSPALFKEVVRLIVVGRRARRIIRRPLRHEDDHALPRTGQDDAIGVLHVESFLRRIDLLPARAAEPQGVPSPLPVTEICIPADAGRIKF